MKILIGADTFPPEINGSATFSSNLAAGLTRRGHDVQVVAPSPIGKAYSGFEEFDGEKVFVHRLRSLRWYPHPWLRFALPWRIEQNSAKILDEVKPDVVHFQSHIITGRGLSHQAQLRDIRIIGTNHVMPDNMIEHAHVPKVLHKKIISMMWDAARRSFIRAEAVTSPTRRAADFLEKSIHISGVLALSNGVDMSHYTPNFEPRTDNLIVFLGRVTGEKQIDKLVRAFALLDPALNARLEIVGGGDVENQLKLLARQLGVADRVAITGYVSEEYLRNALTRAAVFAMPSTAELQSIATMEAMASALPIVGADAMALPHLVHDGVNGFLFEPGDIEELAARLTDVLTMPLEELTAMKQASLEIVKAHDINHTLSTFEALYRGEKVTDTVIGEPPPRTKRLTLAKMRALPSKARKRS
jgi:glycosyltransferase involved in cell wall biosynthesis